MDINYKKAKSIYEQNVMDDYLTENINKFIEKNIIRSIVKILVDNNLTSYIQFADLVIEDTFHDLNKIGFNKDNLEIEGMEDCIISKVMPFYEHK